MSYELNAEGTNGVHETTTVVALPAFLVPQAPIGTGGPENVGASGEPPQKAVWVTDASQLSSDLPEFGPVDGTWSLGGNGGGNGVIGVAGVGGYAGVIGTANPDDVASAAAGTVGVVGYGSNGVAGLSPSPNGVGVIGQCGTGAAVVGWATPFHRSLTYGEFGPYPDTAPKAMPGNQNVGVYGCVSESLAPSHENVTCGVWGDSHSLKPYGSESQAPGVRGTSNYGTGVAGDSSNGAGGVFASDGSGPGVAGKSNRGAGGIFESDSAAQVRLVPSDVPLEQNDLLMQGGQIGDLYLYSRTEDFAAGKSATETVLWLCVAAAAPPVTAMWAQVSLGNTVGGVM